jgi:hypothetical protein
MHHRDKSSVGRTASQVGTGGECDPGSLGRRDVFVFSSQGGQTVDGGGEKCGGSSVLKRLVIVGVVTETTG